MTSLVGLAVAGCEMFCRVSLWSAPVAVGLSVKSNVTPGEGVSIVSGGSIEKTKSLNEELEGETGDGSRSNSWIFYIYYSIFYLLCKSSGHGLFCL